ncbi:DUF3298 and DUF4163 domain-containing protein [Costertonia aggregata]|uniref:DUF4163 domain-containing protein n=1 Tax=Costertonia aggregata TaxID=343403 RepID=A0A7H9AQ64_9FLAO|nr:DUF3298 and DUF4163 domain-containing protein [Costertonia aggregata]QLG45547.1 DUF4163 domain-containing protein [Costertonia aggregata]
MKIRTLYLFLFLICISCKNDEKLTFKPIILNEKKCAECPIVEITVPKALGKNKIDAVVNTAITEEIVSLLTFGERYDAKTIQEATASFNMGFEELQQIYPDETTLWEAKISGEVVYEDKNVLTIRLDAYLFTGGAHGFSPSRFLNFDKNKGVVLENDALFSKLEDFKKLAENKFRKQEDIPLEAPINSTGFMFDGNEFYLPDNIGYTQEGIQLLYEQYEVASYADGPIKLVLPFDEVKKHLVLKTKPKS